LKRHALSNAQSMPHSLQTHYHLHNNRVKKCN
jgi:hypothetical protein